MSKKVVSKMDEFSIEESISKQLLSKSYCSSLEESLSVAEEVCIENNLNDELTMIKFNHTKLQKDEFQQQNIMINGCVQTLLEYISDITEKQAKTLICNAMNITFSDSDDDSQSDDSLSNHPNSEDPMFFDEDEYIGEGECEICERTIKLTKHHLIPKATWPKIKKRMVNASSAILNKDYEQATKILGMDVSNGLHTSLPNFPQKISSSSLTIYLGHNVCKICSPCHKTVHRLHTEMELAEHFNTVEKLLSDERLVKFAKWANKQKTGKYVRQK